jgi:hypothetical protein
VLFLKGKSSLAIHLITNCTKNKRKIYNIPTISISDLRSTTLEDRVHEWRGLIEKNVSRVPAKDLYCGGHWSVVRDIHDNGCEVFVLSAGFGFIGIDSEITRYDATFNTGDKNSILQSSTEISRDEWNIEWWKQLNRVREDKYSLSELYLHNKSDCFFITVPPLYLNVIQPELIELKEAGLVTPMNTFIISSGASISSSLSDLYLPVTADFSAFLRGSRGTLGIRMAQYFIDGLTGVESIADTIKYRHSKLLELSEKPIKYNRKKMLDGDIRLWISQQKTSSVTLALRNFRDEGNACEQKRFGKLFNSVKK